MTAVAEETELVTPTAYLLATAADGSPEWHAVRSGGIGGSDVAAALGMHRYVSPLQLYLDKRGELPELPMSPELAEFAEFGHDLEAVIARRWAKRTGCDYVPSPGTLARVDAPWMRVNLDGIVVDPVRGHGVLELKNRSEYQLSDWEDGVPEAVALQAHWGMAVTGYPFADVAALVGGNKLRYHRIDRDLELEADLVRLVSDFWHHNVLAGVEPPIDASQATADLLGRLYDVAPEKVVDVDAEAVEPLLAERARLKAAAREIDEQLRGVENRIKHLAGDAEVVTADGRTAFTWRQVTQHRLDSKALKADHPDIHAAYTKQSTHRRLNIPGGSK